MLKLIQSYHTVQSLIIINFLCDPVYVIVATNFHRKAAIRELILEQESFFEISQNKNPSKITAIQ